MLQNNLLKTFFSSLDCLDPFDKNQLTTCVWVCSRMLYSSPSIHSTIITPVPLCLNVSFTERLEIRSCKLSSLVLSLTVWQIILFVSPRLGWPGRCVCRKLLASHPQGPPCSQVPPSPPCLQLRKVSCPHLFPPVFAEFDGAPGG